MFVAGRVDEANEKVLAEAVGEVDAEGESGLNESLGLAEAAAPEYVNLGVASRDGGVHYLRGYQALGFDEFDFELALQ